MHLRRLFPPPPRSPGWRALGGEGGGGLRIKETDELVAGLLSAARLAARSPARPIHSVYSSKPLLFNPTFFFSIAT